MKKPKGMTNELWKLKQKLGDDLEIVKANKDTPGSLRDILKKPKYINKPFARLPLKQRACAILTLAGFTYNELVKVGFSRQTVRRGVLRLSDEKYDKSRLY